jgi:cobalt-zinc-cadmium efflux system outer membrane protein
MEDEARRLALQATAAEQQLLSLLGLEPETLPPAFAMEENVTEPNLPADSPELVKTAWAARPDVRAAELAIESAGERLGLEKSSYWNITAILDANGQGLEGFEMGPGVSAWIPVFDRNQGGVSLAEAEMERAVRRYVAVRNRVANEVRDAHSKRVEMESSVRRWRSEIVPRLAETLERTERALDAGDVSFAEFLNARLSYLGGRRRLADLDYDLSAASARLENAVGRSLEDAQ